MKKLKCKSCSKVWYVDDMEQDSQTSCPFCGESIEKEIQFDNIDSFDKAIYVTVKKVGVDVLKTPSKFAAYMMDMVPDFKNEIRFVLRNISEKYANDIFKAFSDSTQDVDEMFIRIRQRLIDEDLASEKWTDIVCSGFKNASLMMRGINPSVVMSVEVKDISVESKQPISKPKSVANDNSSLNIIGSPISKSKLAVNNSSPSNILGGSNLPISKPKSAANNNSSLNIIGSPISKSKPAVNNNSSSDILDSGNCGANAFWKLIKNKDGISATLIIEGSGNMCNYYIPIGDIKGDDVRRRWSKCEYGIRKVEIGKGITSIGDNSFYRLSSLWSVQLPDGLQTIGESAFGSCSELSSIKLPDSLKTIGGFAFSGCYKLQSVNMPDGLKTIGRNAFFWCASLQSVNLPNSLQMIEGCAFASCSSLKEIIIPEKARRNMDKWVKNWYEGCRAKIIYV